MRISARWSNNATVVFDFVLDNGLVAFVDREWSLREESVPALLVGDAEVAWWDGFDVCARHVIATKARDPQQVASDVIAALATTAVAAIADTARSHAAVTGTGVVAASMRALIGVSAPSSRAGAGHLDDERLPAALDTTGSSEEIMGLAARLHDLGTLVMAAPQTPSSGAVDLYSDLHRRGLRVVGVPPLVVGIASPDVHISPAQPALLGQSTSSASWYRLENPGDL